MTDLPRLREALERLPEANVADELQLWSQRGRDLRLVAAAARRFLALTETGRRVAWCKTHDLQAIDAECEAYLSGVSPLRCSPVSVLVIPADYLTEED